MRTRCRALPGGASARPRVLAYPLANLFPTRAELVRGVRIPLSTTTADSFQCHGTSGGGLDSATATGSPTRRSRIQVSAPRSPQDLLSWFGRGSCALGYRSLEITGTCADGECFLRKINWKHPSRVFGLCDTSTTPEFGTAYYGREV